MGSSSQTFEVVNAYYLNIVIDVINITLLLKIKGGIVLMVCEGRM